MRQVVWKKRLAAVKHQPYLVRRVREFLIFTKNHPHHTLEQTLDLFLAGVGVGSKSWQRQQASDAIRVYRYQYRGADTQDIGSPAGVAFHADAAPFERLQEVIRLRYYVKSPEKTYPHWEPPVHGVTPRNRVRSDGN